MDSCEKQRKDIMKLQIQLQIEQSIYEQIMTAISANDDDLPRLLEEAINTAYDSEGLTINFERTE